MTKYKTLWTIVVLVLFLVVGFVYRVKMPRTDTEGKTPEMVVRIGHVKGSLINLPEDILKKKPGIFSRRGLKVEFVNVSSSDEALEAISRGNMDVISSISLVPVLQLLSKRPYLVKVFSISDLMVEQPFDAILVRKDSAIKTVLDISGKNLKYGVFAGTTHLAFTKKYLKSQGVDISKIEFIAMPAKNHLSALASGAIDVLGTYQPNTTIAMQTGKYLEIDASVYGHVFQHSAIGVGVIRTSFFDEHPDLAKAFAESIQEAYQEMMDDPTFAHQVISDVYKLDLAVAAKVPLPLYASKFPFEDRRLQDFIDFLFEMKEIPENVDVSRLTVHF